MKIPIITEDEESEFLKAYDVLEDYQEALDKIGNYEAINIWGDEDEFEDDFVGEDDFGDDFDDDDFDDDFGTTSTTMILMMMTLVTMTFQTPTLALIV